MNIKIKVIKVSIIYPKRCIIIISDRTITF